MHWSEKFLLGFFSMFATALAVLHLTPLNAANKVDGTVVGLLIIAGLPWLGTAIKKIEVPGGWKFEAQDLQNKLDQQQEQISKQQRQTQELVERQRKIVDFIVTNSLHEFIYRHLRIVYDMQQKNDGRDYKLRSNDENMKGNLRELINRNYIEFFDLDHLPEETDLVKRMKITDAGIAYVKLREGITSLEEFPGIERPQSRSVAGS
jgi:hypothetical protein